MTLTNRQNDYLLTVYSICKKIELVTDVNQAFNLTFQELQPALKLDAAIMHESDEDDALQIRYMKSVSEKYVLEEFLDQEQQLAHRASESSNTESIQAECHASHHLIAIPLHSSIRKQAVFVYLRQGSAFAPEEVTTLECVASMMTRIWMTEDEMQQQDQLKKYKKQLALQQDFIANITHDLRNPLGCIKGYTTTLLRTDVEWADDVRQRFLQVINQETDRLGDMITKILDTARLQSGNFDFTFDFVPIEDLISEMLVSNTERHPDFHIHVDCDENLPLLSLDKSKILKAFGNLIDNAIKHANISDIWIKINKNLSGVRFIFADKGAGIESDRLAGIFELFSRIPQEAPSEHGTGLGLYISKQIIAGHHGTINVESDTGAGTRFIIWLPAAQSRQPNQSIDERK